MRANNIPIKITIPFPFDRPDKNGVIYTKEAVKNAFENFGEGLPIVYCGNESYKQIIIGVTSLTDEPVIVCDDEKQMYRVSIKGLLFAGGTECIEGKRDNVNISDFEILSIGISNMCYEDWGCED